MEMHKAKKPRLNGPDGFEKANPAKRPKPPSSPFVSAFDTNSAPKTPRHPIIPQKHNIINTFADTGPSSPPKHAGPHTNLERRPKPPIVPRPPRPRQLQHPIEKQTGNSILAHIPRIARRPGPDDAESSKPMTRMIPAVANDPESPKRKTTRSIFQPNFDLPPTTTKGKYVLRPPPMPISAVNSTTTLKALPPPPRPVARVSPQKNMTTILNTRVAQTTDPTKEGGSAEILSLFLQQHGHNYISSTDRELMRGVDISPSKHSRSRGLKFVEGGLARQADYIFSAYKTSQALWKRRKEQEQESGLHKRVMSDFRLSVIKVIHQERLVDKPGSRPVLALCNLTCRQNTIATSHVHIVDGTYVVSFSTLGNDNIHKELEPGREVYIWPPWHSIALSNAKDTDLPLELARDFSSSPSDMPRNLLICTRYWIVSKAAGS